jgi:hypothetical protein
MQRIDMYKYNVIISNLLTNGWLDQETIKAFAYEQRILQKYPQSLPLLVNKIQAEIDSRLKIYGT